MNGKNGKGENQSREKEEMGRGGVAGLAIVPHEKGIHREGGGYGTAKGSRVIRAC